MKIREYIEQIVANGNKESMEELSEMLDEAIIKLKVYDEKCYEKYKMKLYELAYGKVLNEDMAKEWVESMKPQAKWTMQETNNALNGTGIDTLKGYVVMNMLYSDMSNVLGDGNTQESIDKYIRATADWLNDEDVGQDKLYDYWRYVVAPRRM